MLTHSLLCTHHLLANLVTMFALCMSIRAAEIKHQFVRGDVHRHALQSEIEQSLTNHPVL